MKKILLFIMFLGLLLPLTGQAALIDNVRGMILLQVEANGEAWYVNPTDNLRYYMKDGAVAYQMMRKFGLGITDADLAKIPAVKDTAEMKKATSICNSNSTANRLKGKILLQVQQNGEAWYIYPKTCRRIYLKDGQAAYEIMRYLGLGITNANLNALTAAKATASAAFTSCLDSSKYDENIYSDIALAQLLEINSTPTSVIGEEIIPGYKTLPEWEAILQPYFDQYPGQPIEIATFMDFECPFCARQAAVFDQLLVKYDVLTLTFFHLPLEFHPNAFLAAQASECAHEQGKFFEMHDALFALSLNGNLNKNAILQLAGDLGL